MKGVFKRTLVLMLATFGINQAALAEHCDPNFITDIGPDMNTANGQPNGAIQTFAGDCTGTSGCGDYFDLSMQNAAEFFGTFCSDGGSAAWDTGISVWGPNDFSINAACNDDVCGLASELAYTATSAGVYRVRIGGFGGDNGPYTLAYSAPLGTGLAGAFQNAEPIPTFSRSSQLLMILLLLAAGGIAVRRFRTE